MKKNNFDRSVRCEHGMDIHRKLNGKIDRISMTIPSTDHEMYVITEKDDELVIESRGIFDRVKLDDQWMYDYFDASVHRGKDGKIKEIHLMYTGSKLVHHTVSCKDGEIILDPPVLKELIDYI